MSRAKEPTENLDVDSLKDLLRSRIKERVRNYSQGTATGNVPVRDWDLDQITDLIGQEALGNLDLEEPAWSDVEDWYHEEVDRQVVSARRS